MNDVIEGATQTGHTNHKVQQRLDRLAWLLDSVVPLPGGFKLGLDGLIGLIPVVGDGVSALISTYIIGVGVRQGVPKSVVLKMMGNLFVDTMLGAVPFFGDLFDIANRANHRNVMMMQKYLDAPETVTRSSRLWVVGVVLSVIAVLWFILWLIAEFIGAVLGLF